MVGVGWWMVVVIVECWMLDAGCRVLGAGWWIVDGGWRVIVGGWWMVDYG